MTMWGSAVRSRWCSQYIGIRTRFCPVSAETGCGGLHKNIITDVRPETRAWPNRENWEGWHQSDQTGNMSKRRGEWHISSFSECDGWGEHDTMISLLLIYLLLITYFHYLIASKYTACVKISTYLGYYVFFISACATQRCKPYFAEHKIWRRDL